MRSRFPVTMLAPALLCALVVGCSSGEDAAATTSPMPPTTEAPVTTAAETAVETASASPAPGTITLDASGITDAKDLILLGLITSTAPGQAMAAACQPVTADPFSYTGELLPMTGDNPCALGTEPMEFDPGTYTLVVAAIRGGEQSPQQCTEVDVTVDGNVTVAVTALGPPTDCSL